LPDGDRLAHSGLLEGIEAMLKSVDILGIRVQSGPTDGVVAHIDGRLRQRLATRVAFLNAHLSNVCARSEDLRQRLRDFLVLNDGVGLDIARRVLHGERFEENLNGTDFVTAFLDTTAHDLRIFLLGARPDVVARTAQRLVEHWPRHTVVGFHHGFLEEADEQALSSAISGAKPDLVLVGMGNPRQEHWIATHIPALCPCAMAIGAWFDFFSGSIPRAPAWIRRARAEWIYRLWREPDRLAGRYLVGNAVFLARLAAARLKSAVFKSAVPK
jgi:exopolysaccharide biosynthesis WecB/TagA/CpsF family protein